MWVHCGVLFLCRAQKQSLKFRPQLLQREGFWVEGDVEGLLSTGSWESAD